MSTKKRKGWWDIAELVCIGTAALGSLLAYFFGHDHDPAHLAVIWAIAAYTRARNISATVQLRIEPASYDQGWRIQTPAPCYCMTIDGEHIRTSHCPRHNPSIHESEVAAHPASRNEEKR